MEKWELEFLKKRNEEGWLDKQIAYELELSVCTITTHRLRMGLPSKKQRISEHFPMFYKMGLTDRTIAARCGTNKQNVREWRYRNYLPFHEFDPEYQPSLIKE